MGNGLKYIGKAIAIAGLWLAWAFVTKAAGTSMIEIAAGSSKIFSMFLLIFLYLFLTITAYNAMSAILDRWDKS
jgi:F0F1-type ATP synthase membrane subunit c/vacuolar-type H+-ATPase subunit K